MFFILKITKKPPPPRARVCVHATRREKAREGGAEGGAQPLMCGLLSLSR